MVHRVLYADQLAARLARGRQKRARAVLLELRQDRPERAVAAVANREPNDAEVEPASEPAGRVVPPVVFTTEAQAPNTPPPPRDPRLDGTQSVATYRAAVLRDALLTVVPLVARKDQLGDVRLGDTPIGGAGSTVGVLFATGGGVTVHFECNDFGGKPLHIERDHVGGLTTFLSKCRGEVEVRGNADTMFAIVEGRVFAWPRRECVDVPGGLYPSSCDRIALSVPKNHVLDILKLAKFKIVRLVCDAGNHNISFQSDHGVQLGEPIAVRIHGDAPEAREHTVTVSGAQLRLLLRDCRGVDAEMHVPRLGGTLSTIDEFWLSSTGKVIGGPGATLDTSFGDVFRCRITRSCASLSPAGA